MIQGDPRNTLWDVFQARIDKQRVHSFGVIWIRISDPRSVWIMVHQKGRWIHSGYGSMQHDPDRSFITDPDPDHPKERSLNQENILSHLAKSDGNIRILIETIAYEMRVYSQGVEGIIHETLKHTTIRMAEKEVTHLTCGSLWIADFMLMYCSDN